MYLKLVIFLFFKILRVLNFVKEFSVTCYKASLTFFLCQLSSSDQLVLLREIERGRERVRERAEVNFEIEKMVSPYL